MRKKVLTLALFIGIALLMCSDNEDEEKKQDFDSRLMGVWFQKNISSHSYPNPDTYVHGIRMTEDSSYSFLGVNWNTGEISLLEDTPVRKIIQAENGVIIIQFPSEIASIDTISYEFIGDTLKTTSIYHDEEESDTTIYHYIKGNMGQKICDPIPHEVSFLLNDTLATAKKVNSHIPAFAVYDSILSINISFGSAAMIMKIHHVNAPGEYPIGGDSENQVRLGFFGKPHFGYYQTDNSNGGTINITELNLENNRLKANFQFKTKMINCLGDSPCPDYYEVKEGDLDIPLYR